VSALIILARLLLEPVQASHAGAALAGDPGFGRALSCIAWRESRHELVSVHEGDAWMQRRLGEGLSTRGVHGQVAAFALPSWLHGAPWLLDIPLVSAVIATRRARSWRCDGAPACVRWRGCGR
jgi:hypothetical protein